jgi:CrcB protein
VSPLVWTAFVAAGALGAVARNVVDVAVHQRLDRSFPWGILVVNASGALVLGVITGLARYHGFAATPTIVLGTGFCGAYTTFSTFTFETIRLAEDTPQRALTYALLMLGSGALAAALGLAVTSM